MTATEARARTPSVSELQAALLAARRGAFASSAAHLRSPAATDEHPAGGCTATAQPATPTPPSPLGAEQGAGVWLLGAHGGSGARCLAAIMPATRYAGHRWPAPVEGAHEQVVLVCRTSQRGLAAAQHYARQFRDAAPGACLELLGVIVSADAPGRLPPALRRFERLLSGAVPILGEIPWQSAWRLGPPKPLDQPPAWVTKLQQTLTAVPR